MDLLFPDAGLVAQLSKILSPGVIYKLFTNNFVPTLSSTLGSFTEASWTGYAAVAQNFSNFTINGVAAHSGYAIAPPISFLNSTGAPVQAYGYYVTDAAGTTLLACALFDSPPATIAPAGSLSVVPTWGDFSQLSS
jgi:hypothetical protein